MLIQPVSGEIQAQPLNDNFSYLESKTNNISKGSPAGTYATLAALKAAYPNGNSNIYVVTADGKWYYWSGADWVAGGTYQATGIAEESIDNIKLATGAVTAEKLSSNVYPKKLEEWSFSRYTLIVGEKPTYILPANNEGIYYRHDTAALIDIKRRLSDKLYVSNIYEPEFKVAIHEIDGNGIAVKNNDYKQVAELTLQPNTAYIRIVVSRIDGTNFNLDSMPELKLLVQVNMPESTTAIDGQKDNMLSLNTDVWERGSVTFTNGEIVYNYSETHWRLKQNTFIDVSNTRKLFFDIKEGYRLGIHIFNDESAYTVAFKWLTGTGSFFVPDPSKKLILLISKDDNAKLNTQEFSQISASLSREELINPQETYDDLVHKVNALKKSTDKSEWSHVIDGLKTIGHAGTENYAPGNTLEAYYVAYLMGHWGAECDLAITKDQQLILMHDYTLDRTTNGTGNVSDYTLDQIKGFKVLGNELWGQLEIPTIDEYLLQCQKLNLYPIIEIKDDGHTNGMVELVLEKLVEKNLLNNVILISFSQYVINKIREFNLQVKVARLLKTTEPITEYLVNAAVDNGNAGLNVYYSNVDETGVKLAQSKGVPVMSWTPNLKDDFKNLVMAGVNMITTDEISNPLKSPRILFSKILTEDGGTTWSIKENGAYLEDKATVFRDNSGITIFSSDILRKSIGSLKPVSVSAEVFSAEPITTRSTVNNDGSIYVQFILGSEIIFLDALPESLEMTLSIIF